ncbi:response regulator transcription factor [Neomoorella mulderi]|uniref:Stage 0 sporulation protein A homolog n=1 Tax=Moorella mulderi DSM 14980 TaxID=1122241 RepID=A0A151AXI0_9FIRM|nr:response regulator transcription factor [Moorella mulderi]KYH32107.1 alkaline phosphatase synthesis transcriptional regulatory protein PhoP [Moorella mulderi DSM 14980]
MDKKKILIIEDEEKIATMIQQYLLKEQFAVLIAADGVMGLKKARQEKPDLIILDLMLPGLSGLDVCREIRKESQVPIIMLTAKAEEIDKLLGLELGADDYITKPFSLAELAARIRAVLRRSGGQEQPKNTVQTRGDLTIDFSGLQVYKKGQPLNLTPTEFNLLSVLFRHPGRVYSRLQLLDAALGEAYQGYERSIDTHISNLRRKIEDDPANPRYILTVYGVGYKFGEG